MARTSIALLNPTTLATQGAVNFSYPNALSDLSESFHPEITGSALIDVQGNIQSFTALTANGMVLNDAGNLNLLTIKTCANSSVVGLPFGHVDIAVRNNVSIITNSRLVGDRGDVTVVPDRAPGGPAHLAVIAAPRADSADAGGGSGPRSASSPGVHCGGGQTATRGRALAPAGPASVARLARDRWPRR